MFVFSILFLIPQLHTIFGNINKTRAYSKERKTKRDKMFKEKEAKATRIYQKEMLYFMRS